MKAVAYEVTHYYQPTTNSCGYTALAILLSHYGITKTPEELLDAVPQPTNEDGKPVGSVTAQLATWCLNQGHTIDFFSFDFQITDLSWAGLDSQQLISKLKAVKDSRDVAGIGGKHWSRIYVEAYIAMLEAGGTLIINPHVTTKLLYDLLQKGPVYANICSLVSHNLGRQRYPDHSKRESVPDDINGIAGTHSIVIYGNDERGNFLVADPWEGMEVTDPETMLCAISAAEIECDSQCFQLSKKS
jgi:hypothetical protein